MQIKKHNEQTFMIKKVNLDFYSTDFHISCLPVYSLLNYYTEFDYIWYYKANELLYADSYSKSWMLLFFLNEGLLP